MTFKKGQIGGFQGRHHSEKTKEILRLKILEQFRKKGPLYKGRHHSDETKRKISEAVKKNWKGGFPKGKKNPKLSEIKKEAHRNGKIKTIFIKGNKYWDNEKTKKNQIQALEHHPCWKGGKSFILYPSDFNVSLKKKILKRDDYCCKKCGNKKTDKYRLDIHHIDENKFNNKKENLIVLCRKCHNQITHAKVKYYS